MRNRLRITALASSLLALAIVPATAGAATFTNGGAINTNDNANGSPYPSTIPVSGVTGSITDLNVRLNSFTHPRPFEVGVVMVGPGGQALLLMDGVTDNLVNQPASSLTLSFDDEAPGQIPQDTALTSPSYRPTNYINGDDFPFPGPGTLYGNPGPAGGGTQTLSSIFDGTSPNGTWSLFVRDYAAPNTGQIAGGWSLTFPDPAVPVVPAVPAPTPATPKKCKKGRKLKKGKCIKKKGKKKK